MKVAIAGYGIEGKASYQYWRSLGHQVTIVDERSLSAHDLPYGAASLTGPGSFKSLGGFDLVVRSPGVAPDRLKTDGKIWSATNEFLLKCRTPIIGVTGTKGKGTTSSLIDAILTAAGKRTVLVGNIGRPALEAIEEASQADAVVFEMSSFQLWDVERSPHVAVVLPIEPDHLDVHKNFKQYLSAKANIRRFQRADDICIYHSTNNYSADIAKSAGKQAPSAARYGIADDGQVYVEDGNFCVRGQVICSTDNLRLPGVHNLDNACAAISAAWTLSVDDQAVAAGLRSFAGLDHRLKLVGQADSVKYYDDSIATTPGSAIAAIAAFKQPKVLILGGSDKGADYKELAEAVAASASMRAVLVIGQVGDKIEKSLKKAKVSSVVKRSAAKSMPEIVQAAAGLAQPGDVVILSPAAASFDMFKSYADRGQQFVAQVETLSA
ncbi:MAG TPA: UDP-N-acetylmuramoyl-L-alanine--D-glutamate ligase [Candidatus Saccharimonadales bacterium]|nr:UDP-N-acetylmuramoyl-L-alanine--D-glutamate ligase [Candidatus Saccharimonadales bacterium]